MEPCVKKIIQNQEKTVSSVTHARDELKPTKIQLKGVETMSLMFCPRMPGVRLAEAFMRVEELITIQAG